MQKIIKLYQKISNKRYSTLAGSIAFFLIINGGSVFFLLINLCNYLGYDVFNYVDISYLPTQLSKIIDLMHEETINKKLSLLYTITSVISGSTLFYHLIKVSEIIYETNFVEVNILNRIFSLLLIVVFIVVIVLSFIVFLILNLFTKNSNFNILLKYTTMFLIPFIILFFINKVVTPKYNKIKDIIIGVLTSTIFWFISTILFSIFLKIFLNYKNSYGALSFFIVFMMWIYILSQGLIIGIIINYNNVIKKLKKHKIKMAHSKEVL